MKSTFGITLSLMALTGMPTLPVLAQFYPDSLGKWCLHSSVSPSGMDYLMFMVNAPDTLVNENTYKRIDLIPILGSFPIYRRFYVRSSSSGEGFTYLPELNAEYLTGSLNVNVNDTLYNVLIMDGTVSCSNIVHEGNNLRFSLSDVVVTAIDTISNESVSVVRHTIWPLCPGAFAPTFWQAGMGTEHGPLIFLTPGLANWFLLFASVGDTCYYDVSTYPQGLPGGPACCVVIPNSIEEQVEEASPMRVLPNPSSGIFSIEIAAEDGARPYELSILDPMGRNLVSTTTSSGQATFDLSGRSGLFLVIAESGSTRLTSRIIIQ